MEDVIAKLAVINRAGEDFSQEEKIALNNHLDQLISLIKGSPTLKNAEGYLDQLGYLQSELARACFRWEVPMSERFRELIREFDRSDDEVLRALIYARIKRSDFLTTD